MVRTKRATLPCRVKLWSFGQSKVMVKPKAVLNINSGAGESGMSRGC